MKIKPFVKTFFRDTTALGGMVVYSLITILTLIFGEIKLLEKLVSGFVFTFAIIAVIRMFYYKPRPKPKKYTNFIEKIDASSFPSWHSCRIVFLSLIFSRYYLKLAPLLVIVSLLVTYSRIYLKKHDWKDVFFGALLGTLTFVLTELFF